MIKNAIETGDRAALLRASEEMSEAKNRDSFEECLDTLESLVHDVWTLSVDGDVDRVVNADLTDELSRLAGNAASSDLPFWLCEIETMRANFAVNINRKIATDALFVSMAAN